MEIGILKDNRGADIEETLNWPAGTEENPSNLDLTGFTINIFEPKNIPADLLSVEITNASEGEFRFSLQWSDDAFPPGVVPEFRFQIVKGEENHSSNLIRVYYT